MVKVSIITPVLNGEKYITECIESVLSQSLSDIEYIIVDAGSTDGTLDIIDKFRASDSRIILLNSDKKSYGYQMNLGLKEASGEYIGLVEADDFADCKMFETLYQIAKENNLDALKSNYKTFYGDNDTRSYLDCRIIPNDSLDIYGKIVNYRIDTRIFNTATVTWTGVYKRSFLLENNIWHNESLGASFQDNGFWMQVMISAKRLMFIDESFYCLRRDNAASSVFSVNKVDCLIHEYEFMRNAILRRNVDAKLLLNCFWKKKFDAFGWDVTRNKYEFREQLVYKYADDFKIALDTKEFFDNGLNTNTYNDVVNLVRDKKKYFDEKYRVPDSVIKEIDQNDNIYIYGSGGYAAKLYLRLNGVMNNKFCGFVVTRKDGHDYFMDRLVCSINDVDVEGRTIFVIGVTEKNKQAVQNELERRNYFYLRYDV